MKSKEYEELAMTVLLSGAEVKVRYFTYNKNDYIDIIGKVSSWSTGKLTINSTKQKHNHSLYFSNDNGVYILSMEYLGIHEIHDKFTGKNIPNLVTWKRNDVLYCNMKSSQMISIKQTSIRALKIHQIKNKF